MTLAATSGGGGTAPKLNQALAEEVVSQATAAMMLLSSEIPARASRGRVALDHWNGPDAERFRSQFSAMQKNAQTLHGQLQALIRQVNAAIDAA
jgi:uncharacterized protein YukE